VSDRLLTARLLLLPAPPDHLRALIAGDYPKASRLAGAEIPVGWPFDPEAAEGLRWHVSALEQDPTELLWRVRFIVDAATNGLIGSINLKGPPTEHGDVEIGWGVIPASRGRGFATEAAGAVIEWAFRAQQVRRVTATVPEENQASQKVARRLGMVPTGETKRGLPLWAVSRGEPPTTSHELTCAPAQNR
jgi:ribosomal-protein-alanine N-acetyltransferase